MNLSAYKVPAATILLFSGVIAFIYSTLRPPQNEDDLVDAYVEEVPEQRPDIVAYVNGDPIFVSDVLALSENKNLVLSGEEVSKGRAIVHELVDELIRQKLLSDEARRRNLQGENEVKSAIKLAQAQVLSEYVLQQEVDAAVSERALQNLYNDEATRLELSEEIRVRHILVDTKDFADLLVVKLNAGVAFEEIAEKFSIDTPTAVKGGDLGYLTRGDMLGEFSEVAFSLPVGSRSEPFNTEYGWHIVFVEDRRQSQFATYDELRPKLARYRTYRIIDELVSRLRSDAKVEYVLPPPAAG